MGINSYISRQFSNPEGLGGRMISLVMNRKNRPLYDETIRTQFGYRRYTAEQLESAGANAGFQVRAVPFWQGMATCTIYKKGGRGYGVA